MSIPVEIVRIEKVGFTVLHRGTVNEENFDKFNLVKSPEDGVVRITEALMKAAIPEFVEAIELD